MFNKGGALSTLGIFRPEGNVEYSRLMLMDFNINDLTENPSQEGMLDAEQTTKSNAYT